MVKIQKQWASEKRTSSVFEWSKIVLVEWFVIYTAGHVLYVAVS